MSHRHTLNSVVGLLTVFVLAGTLCAQDAPEVTKEHEVLKQDTGKWKNEVQMFMPGADEPTKSEGTEVCESICGGLFIRTEYKGDVMGMPFEGHSFMGYDKFKKKYTGSWVDNFGTSVYDMEGTYDAEKKALTVFMTGPDPMSGNEMKMKMITTYVDENTKTFEMYGQDPTGQATGMVKMMSMHSVRQK